MKTIFLPLLVLVLSATNLHAQNCYASFQYDTTSCPSVNFYNYSYSDSNDQISSVSWDFGDGGSSTSFSPNYTFNTEGTYQVCLTIYTLNGCSSTSCQSVYVYCSQQSGCIADFGYDTSTCPNIGFYNYSSPDPGNQIVSTIWDFGDGNSSSATNPTHAFVNDGYYDVCLTITTSSGCSNTICQNVPVFCGQQSTCSANFGYDTSNCPSLDFYNYSTAGTGSQIYSYSWIFGDGGSSSSMNPSHTYTSNGTYQVCLTIYTSDSCSSTFCDYVYIDCNQAGNNCDAYIYYSDSACPQIQFFGSSQSGSGISSWDWSFGDGGTSNQQNPTYYYQMDGLQMVCLTVTTNDSCVSTVCDSIYIDCDAGINQLVLDEIQMFPNPATTSISLLLSNAAELEFRIIDLSGKIYMQETRNATQLHQIRIEDLEAGLYLLDINSRDEHKTLRFMKE